MKCVSYLYIQVNAALGAVSKSYGGAGLQLVAGDALAMLMFEVRLWYNIYIYIYIYIYL